MDPKTKAIVAHITLIGWIIAYVKNNEQKDSLTSFYLRQVLGIMILGFFGSYLLGYVPSIGPMLSPIFSIGVLVLWVMSIMGAVKEEEKELPVVGAYFQDWFKSF